MKERAVFILPEQLDYAIWAATTLQNFLMDERILRGLEFETTVQSPYQYFDLLHSFVPQAHWTEVASRSALREADLVFEFDPQVAMRVSTATDRHVVDGFGVMLGTELLEKLPLFLGGKEEPRVLYLPRHLGDSLVDEWPHVGKFLELAESLEIDPLPEDIPLMLAKKEIARSAFCIGVAGGLTLIASGMQKPVLELYPADVWHKSWQAKWSNRWYRMVYAKLDEIEPAFVLELLKSLITRFVTELKGYGIPTKLSPTRSAETAEHTRAEC